MYGRIIEVSRISGLFIIGSPIIQVLFGEILTKDQTKS